jgi:D-arabinose 1-dehydrogenase-like Zn-dependent alcohol dehydrogenase
MGDSMRAARFYAPGEPLRVEDAPAPSAGRGQVLVRVLVCGLCGSDVHFIEGRVPLARVPITLGHEPAGVIESVADGVEGLAPGQRVIVRPGTGCGGCEACAAGRDHLCDRTCVLGMHVDGGLAEYVAVDAAAVIPVPEPVPLEQAAIISDAVATPYHALVDRGALRAGETVAVFGAGGLGEHAIRIARLCGAAVVIAVDVRPAALDAALRAGADAAINGADERAARRIRGLTGGVDLAIECIGRAETIGEAVKSLRRGGRAVVVGMGPEPIQLPPPNAFTWGEQALIGAFGSSAGHVRNILALVAAGRLDLSRSVGMVLPLSRVNEGVDALRSSERTVTRVVIQPHEG